MMNRSTSASSGDASFVPSSMSFAGVGGSSSQQTQKQQHFWEWETNSCSHIAAAAAATTTTNNNNNNRSSFFPSAAAAAAAAAAAVPFQHIDHYFPAPPLLPISPYFASPAALAADYPMGLIKSELDVELSGTAIGLNLGRRTYFSSSNSSDQGFLVDRLFAGSSSSSSSSIRGLQFQYPMFGGGQPPPRCQAEGCKADLFRAKHYHRRHKVCEFHSKATLVVVAGLQQRFCQQCSRFHVLAEFDEAKRSCRKRLADHNRRRRKLPLTSTTATATATATTAVDSSIKPKPAQNSTRHNKDRTSMRGPPADGFCVGAVEVDKGRAGGNSAAAAMYAKLARGGMAIDDSVSVGEEKEMQQRHCSSSSSSSRPVIGNSSCSCCFHPHNFFSHETGAGGGAGQSSTAAASEQQQSHLFQLGQAFFEVDYI